MRRLGAILAVSITLVFGCDDGSELGAGKVDAAGTGGAGGSAVAGTGGGPVTGTGGALGGSTGGATAPDGSTDGPDSSLPADASDTLDGRSDLPEAMSDQPAPDSGSTTPDPDATVDRHLLDVSGDMGNVVSALIRASEGGALEVGQAGLLVPANALAADATLTLAVSAAGSELPNRADIRGDLHTLQPAGTSFVVPVVLTLPLVEAPPADKDAVVAWLNTATQQWVPVPTRVESGKVIALVPHFTTFAVLFVAKTSSCPFNGACEGSPEGTWRYSSGCLRTPPPLSQACGTGTPVQIRQSIEVSGTLGINAGRYSSNQMLTLRSSVFMTPTCLASLNEPSTLYADCAAAQAGLRTQRGGMWTCQGTLAQGCSCVLINMIMRNEAGVASVQGSKVTLTKDGEGQTAQTSDFCVRDNVLSYKESGGAVYTAVKQP